jgi:rhodanese-related sulfurtransferase
LKQNLKQIMVHSKRFLSIVDDAKSRIREVTPEETYQKMQRGDVVVIDTREDHEWDKGHIQGAMHIGKGVLERDIELKVPDLDTEIILYCGGGYRSALAADVLQRMGFTNVFSLAEGWRGWKGRGLPVDIDLPY